ncbi:hypothetical protein HOY80DRAFT_1041851 [Tuber brumale]|nr:hypothetical protein HOY80DRAFT_1041851 [Tuber brumale]
MITCRASFNPSNIQSGFRSTGLVPINHNIIIAKIEACQAKSPSGNANYTNPVSPIENSQLAEIPPLGSLSDQEINHLVIPQNKSEIEQQELIAFASLPRNDSTEWGLKKVISNIAITANRALTEVDEKDRQIQNLKNQLASIQNKKTIDRIRIPTCGQAWIDRDDVARFFELQSAEIREMAQQKYHNATNLVLTRKQKLEECTRKRKNAKKLEQERRLPKYRKTGVALLQEEGRLAEQILDAEQKVKKLEKHLEDIAQNGTKSDEGPGMLVDSQEEETGYQFDQEKLCWGGEEKEQEQGP